MSELGAVEAAVLRDLDRMPEIVQISAVAAAARALARAIDAGQESRAQCARELRACMADLRALAPAKPEDDTVDDLASRRAARRAAASDL